LRFYFLNIVIDSGFKNTLNSNIVVKVKWFYYLEEIETNSGTVELWVLGGIFQTPHTDENDVQTISYKCSVLPLKESLQIMISVRAKQKKIYTSNDTYYFTGSFDPTAMTVNYQPGVLRHRFKILFSHEFDWLGLLNQFWYLNF